MASKSAAINLWGQMMGKKNELSDYLETLSPARLTLFEHLAATVAAVGVPDSINSFVFLPDQIGHPEFADADVVFWKAVEQLYLPHAASDGELPVLYWGFHSYDLLARRSSNGILITDRTLYLMDVGNSSAQLALNTVDVSSIQADAHALAIGSSRIGLDQIARLLMPSSPADSAAYLRDVIGTLQGELGASSSGAVADAAADAGDTDNNVDQLVRASRLSEDFLLPSRPKDAKKLAKLSAKWQLPADESVRTSLSSATLAGIYGLAITDRALYSRDLMEPLDRTALSDIRDIEWVADKKAFRIADAHFVPTLPSITDDNRDYFIALLGHLVAAAS
ncbi:hypothetical protein AB4Y63_08090 [Leifsonia sp. YAF41]|uniref:hypothetical protein n=1 Tax=Leifsonia sp. YAF41 TaxID=3233086 RepID=UPI003F9B628E